MVTHTIVHRPKFYWVRAKVFADTFPDASQTLTEPDGLLAIGGELNPQHLLDAYSQGIFPWYNEDEPILCWSPNPRFVLLPDDLKISKNLRKSARKISYKISFDQAFLAVLKSCAAPRTNSHGTWTNSAIIENYQLLHQLGYAHSVECWHQERLVAGLYGIALGQVFFGESMFSHITDTSKICLVHLTHLLKARGYALIDCQVYSQYLERLGAKFIPRNRFSEILSQICTISSPQFCNQQPWPTVSALPIH